MKTSKHVNRWVAEKEKWNKSTDVRYHVCQETVNNSKVKLEYFPSRVMIEDALTKPLEPQELHTVKELISMHISFKNM